jgi:hypothetical protein
MINLEVTAEEYELFTTLKDSGVFDIRNGVATLNFDSNGTLADIDCNFKLYKRGKPIVAKIFVV